MEMKGSGNGSGCGSGLSGADGGLVTGALLQVAASRQLSAVPLSTCA